MIESNDKVFWVFLFFFFFFGERVLSVHFDHRITSLYVRCVLPEPDNLLIEARMDDAYWRPDDRRSIRNEFKLCSSCVFQKMGAWCLAMSREQTPVYPPRGNTIAPTQGFLTTEIVSVGAFSLTVDGVWVLSHPHCNY